MSRPAEPKDEDGPKYQEGDLIEGLQEDANYFALKYNENKEKAQNGDLQKEEEKPKAEERPVEAPQPAPIKTALKPISRAGGVYVPPHKLRRLQEEMLKTAQDNEEQNQRIKWEMLRKSINEIINKVGSDLLDQCSQHSKYHN